MRFNPLWLIVLLFLLPGAGLLLLPLLLFAALPLLLGLAGGGSLARAPGQLWALKDAQARANLVLAHAACRVLGERYGVAPACWTMENGFFLSGVGDENLTPSPWSSVNSTHLTPVLPPLSCGLA